MVKARTTPVPSVWDVDTWSFQATLGDAIRIAIGEVGGDTAFRPQLRLRAPNGSIAPGLLETIEQPTIGETLEPFHRHDQVLGEDAPVKLLNPDHPLLSIPNKITEADFNGWVDERGTFFLQKWDPKYTALLESHDPGEDPRQGGLVVTK